MRFFTLIFLIISFTANAQVCGGSGGTPQTGNAVCGTLVFPQANVPSCTGPNIPQGPGVCTLDPVTSSNSVWYKFRCYQAGTLGFLIVPNSGGDDYDWEVMDITGRLPQDVYIMDLRLALNLSGETGNTGCTPTGANGPVLPDVNCAGGSPGSQFNRMPTLIVGHDYLLMVTNWSNSGLGYNLSFTGGTAVLTNNIPPTITSVAPVPCNNALIKVDFSEDVLCDSLTLSGSEFSIVGGTNTITGIVSNCTTGTNAVTTLTIALQNPLPAGPYQLVVNNGTDLNTILDVCQDAMPAGVSFPFTVPALPLAPTATTPINYCQGVTATALTATGANLLWYTSATGGTGSATAPIPATTNAGIITYYVSQTIGICESVRTAIVVNINATPAAPMVVSPIHYCPNDVPNAFTAAGTNLLWYANPTAGIGSTTAPTFSTTTAPVLFNFYVSQTLQGATLACEGPRAQIIVDVRNNLTVNIGPDTTICEGQSVKFLPITNPTAITYEWRTNLLLNTIDSSNIKDATITTVDTGRYILKASIRGCITEDTVNVNVLWKPILDAGEIRAICHFDSSLLKGTVTHFSNNLIDYLWTPADSLTIANAQQTYAHPILSTWYKLTATTNKAGYGCDFVLTDSVKITVQPIVYAFAGNDTIVVKAQPHQLHGTGGLNYNWFSPTANIDFPFSANAIATLYNDAQFYLKVTDAIGCEGRDTVFIKVYDGPTYYVPNSFTPNGDGLNDVFRAIPVGMANTTYFRIFNRNGQLMFETNQFLKGWDGTFNGKLQPSGTYVWIVAGTDKNYKKVVMKGTVNVIR
jgi:gliding motility-associated-like protein